MSPAKSSSEKEIPHQSSNFSSHSSNYPLNNSQTGGLVIYYSPDAGNYIRNSKSDNIVKFTSEKELQKLPRHHQFHQTSLDNSRIEDDTIDSSDAQSVSNFVKRPPSFTKALEMSSKLERTGSSSRSSQSSPKSPDEARQSQYEMNYEISV